MCIKKSGRIHTKRVPDIRLRERLCTDPLALNMYIFDFFSLK